MDTLRRNSCIGCDFLVYEIQRTARGIPPRFVHVFFPAVLSVRKTPLPLVGMGKLVDPCAGTGQPHGSQPSNVFAESWRHSMLT